MSLAESMARHPTALMVDPSPDTESNPERIHCAECGHRRTRHRRKFDPQAPAFRGSSVGKGPCAEVGCPCMEFK